MYDCCSRIVYAGLPLITVSFRQENEGAFGEVRGFLLPLQKKNPNLYYDSS